MKWTVDLRYETDVICWEVTLLCPKEHLQHWQAGQSCIQA